MEITLATESRRKEFDDFIINQKIGTFLQSWDWGNWQTAQGKSVKRYFFEQDGKVVGIVLAIFVKSPLGDYFYCPYGPIWSNQFNEDGGSDSIVESLLFALTQQLRLEHNAMFIRIEPTVEINLVKLGAVKAEAVQPPQTLIKDISQTSEELMQSFHSKTRYNIRVAQRNEVEITTYTSVNQDVINLIMQTSRRQGYRNHSSAYIQKLWEFFANTGSSTNNGVQNLKAVGYLATKNSIPLAGGLMIDFGKTRMYLFGGSDYAHRSLMAPYLLHWQAMLNAREVGMTSYDFGAIENASGHTGGYMRFKMGFNPAIINFAGTHDLVINKNMYKIYSALRKINRLRLHAFKK